MTSYLPPCEKGVCFFLSNYDENNRAIAWIALALTSGLTSVAKSSNFVDTGSRLISFLLFSSICRYIKPKNNV